MLGWAQHISSTECINQIHVWINTSNKKLSPPATHEVRTPNHTCENSSGERNASRMIVLVKPHRPRLATSVVIVGRFWVRKLWDVLFLPIRFISWIFYIYWYGYSYIQIKVLNVLSHEKHRGLGFVDWHWKSHITLPGSSLGVSTDLTPVYGWLSGCPVRHGDRWTPISDLAAQVCWHPKHNQIRLGSGRSPTPWPTTARITRTHRHFGGVAGASRITDRGAPPEKLGMSRARPEMDLRLVYQYHWVPVSNIFVGFHLHQLPELKLLKA